MGLAARKTPIGLARPLQPFNVLSYLPAVIFLRAISIRFSFGGGPPHESRSR